MVCLNIIHVQIFRKIVTVISHLYIIALNPILKKTVLQLNQTITCICLLVGPYLVYSDLSKYI